VTRLNTYTTEPAAWDDAAWAAARRATVVTFASPSAVKVWAERVGTALPVACIGLTSGAAAAKRGFARVDYPAEPGIGGWAASVRKQLQLPAAA
jgi:uroporphyrinogen-III synthase